MMSNWSRWWWLNYCRSHVPDDKKRDVDVQNGNRRSYLMQGSHGEVEGESERKNKENYYTDCNKKSIDLL
jgi:hypothetical protein